MAQLRHNVNVSSEQKLSAEQSTTVAHNDIENAENNTTNSNATSNHTSSFRFPFVPSSELERITWTAIALGTVIGFHVGLAMLAYFGTSHQQQYWVWALYVIAMCTFHLGEFLWAARFWPSAVTWDAFLLNHSPQYHYAIIAGVAEFWLESYLLPGLKFDTYFFRFVSFIGFLLVIGGQVVRTAAMWTAKRNFTHLVQDTRHPDHVLVTTGIYYYLRHPSYFGWFWWSVGTQLLLANPFCTVLYVYAAQQFFRGRIALEEAMLFQFFGSEYGVYVRRTWIGIPGL